MAKPLAILAVAEVPGVRKDFLEVVGQSYFPGEGLDGDDQHPEEFRRNVMSYGRLVLNELEAAGVDLSAYYASIAQNATEAALQTA